jgi:nitroreductase
VPSPLRHLIRDLWARLRSCSFFVPTPRAVEKYRERGAQLYSLQDAAIAYAFAMLAATAQGLSTVWIGAFDPEAVRKLIGAPVGITPVAILPIGYPAEQPELTTRRRLEELVHEMPG